MMRRLFAIISIVVATPALVWAAQIAILAIVAEKTPPVPPDTVVIFRGIAYPDSQVTIQRDNTTLVEVPADPAARFDVTLGDQPPGTVTYTIFGSDEDGRVGNAMNFRITIAEGSTITMTGIFLGPTIEADKTQLRLGETITILGRTAPESDVTVFIESGETKTFTTSSDAEGLWVRQVLSTDVGVGDHTAQAKAVTGESEISDFSGTVAFSVTELPPDRCTGRNRADINCDGRVNLTDFSILLFFWKQTNPSNVRADINRDHVVNLTDLSILLFNWSR